MQKSHKKGILLDLPDTIAYNSTINVCANSKHPHKAEFWLRKMQKDYQSGNTSAQPNERSFTTAINVWAQLETKEGAEQSGKILNDVILYAQKNELHFKPDTVNYSTVMNAYAKAGLPKKAEAMLHQQYDDFMAGNERAALNAQCFNTIIHSWAKSKEIISGENAELVLSLMIELNKQGTLEERPDVYTYNALINAWATLAMPGKAREVFDRMLDDCNKGNRTAKPDEVTFRTLLQAYSKAKTPNAGELADDLLEKMKRLRLKPRRATFIEVVKCWRCSLGQDPRAEARQQELDDVIDEMKI